MKPRLRGLYAITPEHLPWRELEARLREALAGGVALLQYRRKAVGTLEEAAQVVALAARHGVPVIVNDSISIARACGAAGVHLGRDDGRLEDARAGLPGRIVGASCYDRLDLARTAVVAGADYVAFGSVYPSPTKPKAVRAPLSLFGEARVLGVPLAAIGGITLERAPELVDAGADLLAVISDLFDAPDIAARAAAYGRLFS